MLGDDEKIMMGGGGGLGEVLPPTSAHRNNEGENGRDVLKMLLRTRLRLKRRAKLSLACELLLPALLVLLLWVGYNMSEIDHYSEKLPSCDLIVDFRGNLVPDEDSSSWDVDSLPKVGKDAKPEEVCLNASGIVDSFKDAWDVAVRNATNNGTVSLNVTDALDVWDMVLEEESVDKILSENNLDIPPKVRKLIDEYLVQDVLAASSSIANELVDNATFAGGLAEALGFELPELKGNLKEAVEKYSMLEAVLGGLALAGGSIGDVTVDDLRKQIDQLRDQVDELENEGIIKADAPGEKELSDAMGALADLLDTLDKDKKTGASRFIPKAIIEQLNDASDDVRELTFEALENLTDSVPDRVCVTAPDLPLLGVVLFERFMDYVGPLPTPPFDLIVAMHYLIKAEIEARGKTVEDLDQARALVGRRVGNLLTLGDIVFAINPSKQSSGEMMKQVKDLVAHLEKSTVFFDDVFYPRIFENIDDAVKFCVEEDLDVVHADDVAAPIDRETRRGYSKDLPRRRTWALVEFFEVDKTNHRLDYAIRMNYTTVPTTRAPWARLNRGLRMNYQQYYTSGFMPLMNLLDSYVMDKGELEVTQQSVAAPFPASKHEVNEFYAGAGLMMGLMMTMSTLYPASRFMKAIVEEKESRMKELLLMSGMREDTYIASWILSGTVVFGTISIIEAILIYASFVKSSGLIVVFWLFMYNFSCLMMSFMLSTLFSRAKLAAMMGPIALFVTVLPRYVFFGTFNDESVTWKYLASLFSPTAFSFGCDFLSTYEEANAGVHISNMAISGEFSFFSSLLMCTIDSAVYFVLGVYLGSRKKGCCRMPKFLKRFLPSGSGSSAILSGLDSFPAKRTDADFEDQEGMPTITAKNLCKIYDDGTAALNGVDIQLHPGQVNVLLGHNGAGKSTFISCLTGLIPFSSGELSGLGHDLATKKGMRAFRKQLGVCPQGNVLWANLSVSETLAVFGTIRGLHGKHLKDEIDEKIRLVGLDEKVNAFAKNLSGGQKRKLCLACAFINSPKVIVLDEPTSGVDPVSRRKLWTLIRERARLHKSVVLLTTHFMDEANLLGDRISILSKGHLRCSGSPLFLKERFGAGYILSVETPDSDLHAQIECELSTEMTMQLSEEHTAERVYKIDGTNANALASSLEYLESIDAPEFNFGLSMTTLEQVFLRLANEGDGRSASDAVFEPKKDRVVAHESDVRIEVGSNAPMPEKSLKRRATLSESRDEYLKTLNGRERMVTSGASAYSRQYIEVLRKRYHCIKRDRKAFCYLTLLPVIAVALTMLLMRVDISRAGPSMTMDPETVSQYSQGGRNSVLIANRGSQKSFIESYLDEKSSDAVFPRILEAVENGCDMDALLVETDYVSGNPKLDPTNPLSYETKMGGFVLDDVLEHSWLFTLNDEFKQKTRMKVPVNLRFNTTSRHTLPSYTALLHNALLHRDFGSTARVSVKNHPLPLTSRAADIDRLYLSHATALFLLIPFIMVTGNYAQFVVKERQIEALHLHRLTGMRSPIYWLANFTFDFGSFLLIVILTLILAMTVGNMGFVDDFEKTMCTFAFMSAYGASVIPFTYCISLAFSSHSSAMIGTIATNFVCGFIALCAK